jgi:hypothetical protein
VRLVLLAGDDQALDRAWQLIGGADRPTRPVGQGLEPVLLAAIEDLVAGLARDAERARQTSVIGSPSHNRDINRRRSSITEHSFQGIPTSRQLAGGVTHVSGTFRHRCLGPLTGAPLKRLTSR